MLSLALILAIIFTACLGCEALSNDALVVKLARIVKFIVGIVFCLTLAL